MSFYGTIKISRTQRGAFFLLKNSGPDAQVCKSGPLFSLFDSAHQFLQCADQLLHGVIPPCPDILGDTGADVIAK